MNISGHIWDIPHAKSCWRTQICNNQRVGNRIWMRCEGAFSVVIWLVKWDTHRDGIRTSMVLVCCLNVQGFISRVHWNKGWLSRDNRRTFCIPTSDLFREISPKDLLGETLPDCVIYCGRSICDSEWNSITRVYCDQKGVLNWRHLANLWTCVALRSYPTLQDSHCHSVLTNLVNWGSTESHCVRKGMIIEATSASIASDRQVGQSWWKGDRIRPTILIVGILHVVPLISKRFCIARPCDCRDGHINWLLVCKEGWGGTVARVIHNWHAERLILSASCTHVNSETNRTTGHLEFRTWQLSVSTHHILCTQVTLEH